MIITIITFVKFIWPSLFEAGIFGATIATILFKGGKETAIVTCTTLSQNVFGQCLRINRLNNDSDTAKKLLELTTLHAHSYVILREALQLVARYASRCMLVASPMIFALALCRLAFLYAGRKPQTTARKKRKISDVVAQVNDKLVIRKLYRKIDILAISSLICSSLILLAVIGPLCYELYFGGALDYQLSSFDSPVAKAGWLPWPFASDNYLRTAVFGGRQCLSVFGLFSFRCLRETLFDLSALAAVSGTLDKTHDTLHHKLCLQIHLSNLNCVTLFAWLLLASSSILLFALVVKVILFPFKCMWNFLRTGNKVTRFPDRDDFGRHSLLETRNQEVYEPDLDNYMGRNRRALTPKLDIPSPRGPRARRSPENGWRFSPMVDPGTRPRNRLATTFPEFPTECPGANGPHNQRNDCCRKVLKSDPGGDADVVFSPGTPPKQSPKMRDFKFTPPTHDDCHSDPRPSNFTNYLGDNDEQLKNANSVEDGDHLLKNYFGGDGDYPLKNYFVGDRDDSFQDYAVEYRNDLLNNLSNRRRPRGQPVCDHSHSTSGLTTNRVARKFQNVRRFPVVRRSPPSVATPVAFFDPSRLERNRRSKSGALKSSSNNSLKYRGENVKEYY